MVQYTVKRVSVQSLSVQEFDILGQETVLVVRARMLRSLFPEGNWVKSACEGCVGSCTMLVALQMEQVL